jgi:hypothetical protein
MCYPARVCAPDPLVYAHRQRGAVIRRSVTGRPERKTNRRGLGAWFALATPAEWRSGLDSAGVRRKRPSAALEPRQRPCFRGVIKHERDERQPCSKAIFSTFELIWVSNPLQIPDRLPRRRPLGPDINRIERLAGSHEQPIALGAAKAQVGSGLRQPDPADQLALWGPYGHPAIAEVAAGVARYPEIAIDIAARAIRSGAW